MNYAATQRNTPQSVVGFLLVLVLHVLLFYALANGLGQRLMEAVSTPMQVTLIPEQVKPLPEPPRRIPLPPKAVPPPPERVPPPEVKVATPSPPTETITVAVAPLPPKPVVINPPPAPRVRMGSEANCITPPPEELQRRYPRQAKRDGVSGRVLLRLSVAPNGDVIDAVVREAQPPKVFDAVALDFVRRFKCSGKGNEAYFVDQEITFKLD
jgi:protein TonB